MVVQLLPAFFGNPFADIGRTIFQLDTLCFAARQELAHELHYTGSTSDSAAMYMWLHKQVMIKLAENGGKVPEAFKH